MRIVLDTNVLISGLIGGEGHSSWLLRLWTQGAFTLVTSEFQIDELSRVLNYARLRKRIDPSEAASLLADIRAIAEVVNVANVVDISPDPDDNEILAVALAGNADLVVSGDKWHMVTIGSVDGIAIVTPRQATERLACG